MFLRVFNIKIYDINCKCLYLYVAYMTSRL